ncbi:MAG: tannase/feruloyl esterase family alpha/beta hydrolase [Gemmatimonadaceae bacterium]
MRSGFSLLSAVALVVASSTGAGAAPCDSLATLNLLNTKITRAEIVPPGAFHLPAGGRRPSVEIFTAYDRLPAFCRVQAVVAPSQRSHIGVEVWLPVTGWNGRYLGAGNGGYAGSLSYFRLGEAINSGYVGASTDTGHRGSSRNVKWSVGQPEKQTDFDYRAVHEMTAFAKAVVRAFYGKPPDRSYFSSCSNGGRQGLMEAERYPDDYDGIMAGAPAYHFGFRTFVGGRLQSFRDRGGKLMIYHGSADAPQGSIDYYRRAVSRMGRKNVDEFMQLYLVPGMGHCGSGEVPNDFGQWLRKGADSQHSMLKALERWVENGVAPTDVIATQYRKDGDVSTGVLRTRPLCPYPGKAAWSHSGNKYAAENYTCELSTSK